MSLDRRLRSGRRTSLVNASYYRSTGRQPPVIWNLQGVRGQMSSNCLWHACRALFAGLLLFGIGTVMCISGFYADGVFDDSKNSTRSHYSREMYFRDRDAASRQVKFSKLSYIGPIVMGVGGFIIVATCVMTFEARDSAAKVGPAAFGTATSSSSHVYPLTSMKSRSEVRSVGSQTHASSLSASTLQLFDRKHILDAFRKFSKTLRSSASVTSWQGEQFHRSPSAPSLLSTNLPTRRGSSSNISSTRRFLQRSRIRVPPALRQTMSVDCSNLSSTLPPLSYRHNSSTQTLTLPQIPMSHFPRLISSVTSGETQPHPKMYRSVYSTSSECYHSTTSNTTLNRETEITGSETTLRYENESILQNVNASVHCHVDMNEILPNGPSALTVIKSNAAGSSSSLRTLSPHPSCYSNDSFDRSSAKSEQLVKSPILLQKSRLRSVEYSCNRPSLLRQSRVDYSEITCIPHPDEEDTIVKEEDLSTIPE